MNDTERIMLEAELAAAEAKAAHLRAAVRDSRRLRPVARPIPAPVAARDEATPLDERRLQAVAARKGLSK